MKTKKTPKPKQQFVREVKTLAFLITESGATMLVTKSAEFGKYIVTTESLFGPLSCHHTVQSLERDFGIVLPEDFKHTKQ